MVGILFMYKDENDKKQFSFMQTSSYENAVKRFTIMKPTAKLIKTNGWNNDLGKSYKELNGEDEYELYADDKDGLLYKLLNSK